MCREEEQLYTVEQVKEKLQNIQTLNVKSIQIEKENFIKINCNDSKQVLEFIKDKFFSKKTGYLIDRNKRKKINAGTSLTANNSKTS